jgi:hypothetical protein
VFSQDEYRNWFDAVAVIAGIEIFLKKDVRDQQILDAYYEPKLAPTLQEIADQFDLTRQRVHQILNEKGTGLRPRQFSKTEYRRFAKAIAVAARLYNYGHRPEGEERVPQHGTRNEYGFYGCRCDLCRAANKEAVYESIGFVPKYGRERYLELVREFGVPGIKNMSIEEWAELKRSYEDGSK